VELSTRLDEPPTDPEDMVGAAGIEPATLGLEIRCSIRLSYAPLDQATATSTRGSSQSVVWGTTREVPAQPQYRTAPGRLRVQRAAAIGPIVKARLAWHPRVSPKSVPEKRR
jgi:hypothetical protein